MVKSADYLKKGALFSMPISDKILKLIHESDATDDQKALLIQILEVEDKGAFRFKESYEKILKDYLASKKEGVNDGDTA